MKKFTICIYVFVIINLIFIDLHLYDGYNTKKNIDNNNVLHDTEILANTGDVKSMESLMLYYFDRDNSKARFWAEQGYKKGSILATNNLATMYQYGIGGGQNIKKSMELYIKTANMGSLIGIRKLGILYLEDDNGDASKGINLLTIACKQKDKESCEILGAIKPTN